ncbi:MAG TPA: CoA-transferase, partial [Acidimicrobiales bacterium]|nr:CoA-transferase [Acidimicrobiales bacterium]
GAKRVIITMEHATKTGGHKIVNRCSLPLTGMRVVNLIITDLAVIRVSPQGLVLEETAPNTSVEEVQRLTEPELIISEKLHVIEF